jgi:hypothetical protein
VIVPRCKIAVMSKRNFPLIALAVTAAVLFTVVAHACSDLSSIKGIVQAPCDHTSSQNEPRGKAEKDNCDSVRYGMLSTQASSAETELSKFYSIPLQEVLVASFSLPILCPRIGDLKLRPSVGLELRCIFLM